MFCKKILYGLTIALAFSFFSFANAQDKESLKINSMKINKEEKKIDDEKAAAKPWNEVCPVKGNKVQEETVLVEYNGKHYGFCCPGCDTKFEKNPVKYSKNLSKDGKEYIGK
jgi:YHS domain-containing protein